MSNITLKTPILNDEYTQYVYDVFDIQDSVETTVNISYDISSAKTFKWNIGVILGSSGSGKTSILNKLGGVRKPTFDRDKPLISNFDWLTPKEVSMVLTSMGLSSVPTWLRPFHALSNGEQYRASLAYLVASARDGEVILVDEYTSVVDRDVAKAMSFALQKYVRREGKRIVVASCHYDILEWLMPDWTCSPQKGGTLERGDWLRRGRPQIELSVSRVESSAWNLFKEHHYLTSACNKGFGHLLFEWNEKPVGIVVYKNQPSGTMKNAFGLSRTVVLPDYQGMGIGSKISEFTCQILKSNGVNRVFTKTVNPALGEYRERSSDTYRPTAQNLKQGRGNKKDPTKYTNQLLRPSYCHEYIGEPIEGYENLLLPVKEMRMIFR
jgi:ABC-type lipoprotein export system ATPase subunit/GNAT superfamily N-acetyltransferase